MSVLSRLRGRRAHANLVNPANALHPGVCRCEGTGEIDGDACPVQWVARDAPVPRWLIGRITRGSQR